MNAANYGDASTWDLPHRRYGATVPATEQQRREWVIEKAIALYLDYDEDGFELIRHAVRPDLQHSQVWEACEELCRLSAEVGYWERKHGNAGPWETAKQDYDEALTKFARAPLTVVTS